MAMKQLLKSYQSVDKAHKEIKIMAKFQSKNVIKIDEVYESEVPYISYMKNIPHLIIRIIIRIKKYNSFT